MAFSSWNVQRLILSGRITKNAIVLSRLFLKTTKAVVVVVAAAAFVCVFFLFFPFFAMTAFSTRC